jgi:hypothetical protein
LLIQKTLQNSRFILMQTVLIHVHSPVRRWTDRERRSVWWLISAARNSLGISLDPVVANAFVILQRYFHRDYEQEYELFYLISAALLTSCKAANAFRSASAIMHELSRICKLAKSAIINEVFAGGPGITEGYQFTDADIRLVVGAEIELLRAIDFDCCIDTPFPYFRRWKDQILEEFPDFESIQAFNTVIVGICLMICSQWYLEVPPEVAAAAAASEAFGDGIPWIGEVQRKYGTEVFNLAMRSIRFEKSRTVQRPG